MPQYKQVVGGAEGGFTPGAILAGGAGIGALIGGVEAGAGAGAGLKSLGSGIGGAFKSAPQTAMSSVGVLVAGVVGLVLVALLVRPRRGRRR